MVLVLPLFGCDPAVQMEEMVRSGRYGKRELDQVRITESGICFDAMGIFNAFEIKV